MKDEILLIKSSEDLNLKIPEQLMYHREWITMEWISVKDQIPVTKYEQESFVLAYHTVHGIGVAWFWIFDEDNISMLEEDFNDKYICSCQFIINKLDGNYCIEDENDIDIFIHSPHFKNLGTVTHWMPLPELPKD